MATSEELGSPDATSPVRDFLLHFMPEKCYEHFFTNFNLMHVPCLRVVLGHTAGLWVLLGTLLAPVPQLLRVARSGRAAGLSLASALLHLYSVSGPLVYCLARDFPLSAWSEKLLIAIQAALMCFLILHYRGRTVPGLLLLPLYGAVVLLLGASGPTRLTSILWSSSLLALIASKAVQVGTNLSSGQTGELSCISVLLVWASSLALVFISFKEKGTFLAHLTHILSAILSTILLAQVLRHCGQTHHQSKGKNE